MLWLCALLVSGCYAAPEWVFGSHVEGSAYTNGNPIDVQATNAGTQQQILERPLSERQNLPLIIVPGYTPIHTKTPVEMAAAERRRVAAGVKALKELNGLALLVTGGNVHPNGTQYNEAWEMRAVALDLGLNASDIVLEPYARHTTTNLRNAARFMLAYNISKAVITTNEWQEIYLDEPDVTGFTARCVRELGYKVGSLAPMGVDLFRITYEPDVAVWTRGTDARDP